MTSTPTSADYLEGTITLAQYADRLDAQEWLYPDNYVKLRFLENHDRARAAHILPDEPMRRNWTAFNYFQRGLTLVYAGQEVDAPHVPSLFDKDPVNWQTLAATRLHFLQPAGRHQARPHLRRPAAIR